MEALDQIINELKSKNIELNINSIPSSNFLEEQKKILLSKKSNDTTELLLNAIDILLNEVKKKKSSKVKKTQDNIDSPNRLPYFYYPWGGWHGVWYDNHEDTDASDDTGYDTGSSDAE